MRQRVMIAMALVVQPALVIADEPTTALDVTIQAQILELLADLQRRLGTSILMITHDLGVIARSRARVVMYAARWCEEAPVERLFARAHHPYTEGLLRRCRGVGQQRERLASSRAPSRRPRRGRAGCRFHDRCPYAWERCARAPAALPDRRRPRLALPPGGRAGAPRDAARADRRAPGAA
jgi:oligopeptide/dipeptide ABC transporter ATP-binding protein